MKRTREAEPLQWEDYVDENDTQQLQKLAPGPNPAPELLRDWHYQYVVSWLYNVCSSPYTENEGKPMFSQITFDEKLLCEDLPSNADDSLFLQVQQHILQCVTHNKKAQLSEWDVAVKYNLAERNAVAWYTDGAARFADLSALQQFEVLHACIKYIERKHAGFRMYLGAHLALFQYPECVLGDRVSLVVLPGGKIVEKTWTATPDAQLRVPIKFRNCSVRYEDDGKIEVFHLDFAPDINDYLSRVSVQFRVLAASWTEYLEYMRDVASSDKGLSEFLAAQLAITAANEVNGRRLLHNRERERSMAELLVRRKRSSRLVAREEETQRRDLEAQWLEKLDERDHFLRVRQRQVAKHTRALKDLLWSVLWERFELDVKVEKLRRRTLDGGTATPISGTASPGLDSPALDTPGAVSAEEDGVLTVVDRAVLADGAKFHGALVEVPPALPEPLDVGALELPDELLITREDLSNLANHGVPIADFQPDATSWYFQCPCNVEAGADLGHLDLVRSQALVCCDACLRWQHLDCQRPDWLALLSQSRQKPLQNRDFATAVLGSVAPARQRRSTRRQATDEPAENYDADKAATERPTSKKTSATTHPESFICAWCIQALEQELRTAFPAELTQVRAKQRKDHLDRERRKKQKEGRAAKPSAPALLLHPPTLPSQL